MEVVMTDTERHHLREEREKQVLADIDKAVADDDVWRAQYDLWRVEHR
jgi:hypothetical protein